MAVTDFINPKIKQMSHSAPLKFQIVVTQRRSHKRNKRVYSKSFPSSEEAELFIPSWLDELKRSASLRIRSPCETLKALRSSSTVSSERSASHPVAMDVLSDLSSAPGGPPIQRRSLLLRLQAITTRLLWTQHLFALQK